MSQDRRMVRRIAHFLQAILNRFGYHVVPVRLAGQASLSRFFPLLQRQGFQPRHVLDVGANQGSWTRKAIQYWPEAQYLLIEPQGDLKVHIQDLTEAGHKIDWVTAGVSDKPGILDFTISPDSVSSSFVSAESQALPSGHKRVQVEVHTVDDLIRARGLPAPDMIKIDAEGFDLRVLNGAAKVVGVADVILMEVGVVARGIENTALAVLNAMAAAGYRLIDITDINRSPRDDALWLCEFAFLRNGSTLLDRVASYR